MAASIDQGMKRRWQMGEPRKYRGEKKKLPKRVCDIVQEERGCARKATLFVGVLPGDGRLGDI